MSIMFVKLQAIVHSSSENDHISQMMVDHVEHRFRDVRLWNEKTFLNCTLKKEHVNLELDISGSMIFPSTEPQNSFVFRIWYTIPLRRYDIAALAHSPEHWRCWRGSGVWHLCCVRMISWRHSIQARRLECKNQDSDYLSALIAGFVDCTLLNEWKVGKLRRSLLLHDQVRKNTQIQLEEGITFAQKLIDRFGRVFVGLLSSLNSCFPL